MNGVLYIDKPKGMTSRDVVNQVCKIYHTKKVGHSGTLDPMATGVLVLALGKATKLIAEMTAKEKTYIASVQMGMLTDTLDTTGTILEEKEIPDITKEQLEAVLQSFFGEMEQEVPSYSAVKVNGRRLYDYARANEEVELPKKKITIVQIELLSYDKKTFSFLVQASKGTYIRSLIRDIGVVLGTPCTMSELRRTKQGTIGLDDCVSLGDITEETPLISIDQVLEQYPCHVVTGELLKRVQNGASIPNLEYNTKVRIHDENGKLLALYRVEDETNLLKADCMFLGDDV